MSSDNNVFERLFKLWATVCKLIVDGKRDPEKVLSLLQKIVDEKLPNPYLRSIATGILGATTGQRTLAKMKKLFTGGLDSDFTNWGTDVEGTATTDTPFEVYELTKDGSFKEIFGGFGIKDLKGLCWSQDQIIKFAEDHSDKLHPQGWATFFLFCVKFDEGTENEREVFFVADVRRDVVGRLGASVRHLPLDGVWYAELRYRFVIPQLAA